jgi:hypothetical protein
MSLPVRTTAFASLAVAAMGLGALVAACGGDGDKAATPAAATVVFSEANANKDAHDALLKVADLPGQGWSVTANDVFSDDTDTPPGDACKAAQAARDRVKTTIDAARTGRSEVKIARDGDTIPTEVEEQLSIFRDLPTLETAWSALLDATGGTTVQDCLSDALKAATAGQGVTVTAAKADPLATPPEGGRAVAADVTVTAGGDPIKLHYETYYWKYGNAGVTVIVNGNASDLTADISKAAIAAAEQHLKDTAK